MSDTPESPLRVAYSRAELSDKLTIWMVKEFGHPRDHINDPDQRDAWYRNNGLIHQFICDHFPVEDPPAAVVSER